MKKPGINIKMPKINIKAFDRFKKNKNKPQDNDGLDILTEAKEPFSLSGFFETHVMERARQVKRIMDQKGILFFLFSPFQARARLIAELFILLIGVLFGVIPRAGTLVNALQDQAYASEIAGLGPRAVGSITLTPAASSNYKKMHMIAFVVEGKNLPSDSSKYEVHLARSYGASDWADVTYSWTMYPVDDMKRILLVAIDQSKQKSGYGAFDLYVQLAGDEVESYMKVPFEITLSVAQDTTDLYNKTGIHLSALTGAVCGTGQIAKKQAEFEEALAKYQVAVEQAEAMPVDISVSPARDELENYCLANRVYRGLDDYSTTEDILSMEKVEAAPDISYDVAVTSGGIEYDKEFVSQLKGAGGYSDEDAIIFTAFESVDTAKDAVIAAMNNVNTEAMSWYDRITECKLVLNQTIQYGSFPFHARCTNTIEEDINFIDGEITEPAAEDSGGLSGTMAGDETYEKPEPSGDAGKTENPSGNENAGTDAEKEDNPEDSKKKYPPATAMDSNMTGDPADSK